MRQSTRKKILDEGKRRVDEWLRHGDYKILLEGGMLLFDMRIGLFGYPFEKPDWMKHKKFNKFVTENQFESEEYNQIIAELYYYFYRPCRLKQQLKTQL